MSHGPGDRPKLARKARLRHDRFTGRDMLLYPERGLSLNPVAAAIARRLDGARTVEAIVAEVSATFLEARPEEVEGDVLAFLDALAARGLLELDPDLDPPR